MTGHGTERDTNNGNNIQAAVSPVAPSLSIVKTTTATTRPSTTAEFDNCGTTVFATTSEAVITLTGDDDGSTATSGTNTQSFTKIDAAVVPTTAVGGHTDGKPKESINVDQAAKATSYSSVPRPPLSTAVHPGRAATGSGAEATTGSGCGASGLAPAEGGTYRFQSQLPRLQVPPLSDTLERYLEATEPLLTAEAFEKTKAVVEEFKTGGEGEALQRALLEYASDKDSYVEEFWDDSYLTPKGSVVLNLNPFFVFQTPSLSDHLTTTNAAAPPFAGVGSPLSARVVQGSGDMAAAAAAASKKQALRAASLLYSSLRFASAVKNETLPPDVWRDTPLCMSQYRRLFGAHRKAVVDDPDEMRVCKDSGHVVILCRNQFYFFSGLHADGRVGVTEQELGEIVRAVQEDAEDIPSVDAAAQAVGALTTQTRSDWAMARSRLTRSNVNNKRFLKLVDTALFVLCLDHTSPSTPAEIAASCLHGSYALDGDTQIGTCTNRWYDKLQVIVFQNGAAGVNFEHTWVDGHTVLRFASDVFADIIYRFANELTSSTGGGRSGIGAVFPPDKRPFTPCEGRAPQKMEWQLSPAIRKSIYFAETRLSDLIHQHDVQALEYCRFGKRFITAHKMSPDAFVQMGILYGYYSLYGDVVSAYEPVLTKVFLKGRTEGLRAVTTEVKAFLEAFTDPDAPEKQKMAALRDAIASHGRLVKLAAKGKGVDRHLFALMCLAKKRAEEREREDGSPPPELPAIFADEAWEALNHVVLSTSNCGNPSLRLFGFGPVVRDGFGIGYIIKDTQLKMVVTSKNRQTDRFVGKIREFFDAVFDIYSPAQERTRMRVTSATVLADDSGAYSMWGSFVHKSGEPSLHL